MSKADQIFINMCKDILENGTYSHGQIIRAKWEDGIPAHTIKKFGVINKYNLQEEFPILTLRPTNLKASIDEILWIFQKKSNNIKDLNSRIWNQWADENGSIGKCYGFQFQKKHKYKEGWFDQVDRVLYDLEHNPYSRRIMTNIYNFEDLHAMNLYPCAYSMTFNVEGNKLNGILNQRSQDVLAANSWNTVQYACLIYMFAQVSNLEVGEFIHVICDAHIYDRHVSIIEELINRESYNAPRLIINNKVKNFYDFTVDDFVLEGYKCGEQIKGIPIAV